MSELPAIPASATRAPRRAPAAGRVFRKPTGKSPWPVMLLVGGPQAPTARAAAEASASDLIDRTLWLSWGERTPDALGATPAARFEIVEHDGTLDDFEDALQAALAVERAKGGKPHLIVVDGISQLADAVRDWAREAAAGPSYWYAVGERWRRIFTALRGHGGPVLLIGRADGDAVAGVRDLGFDVDVLAEHEGDDVQVHGQFGSQPWYVTASRTSPTLHRHVDSVEAVWLLLRTEVTA